MIEQSRNLFIINNDSKYTQTPSNLKNLNIERFPDKDNVDLRGVGFPRLAELASSIITRTKQFAARKPRVYYVYASVRVRVFGRATGAERRFTTYCTGPSPNLSGTS